MFRSVIIAWQQIRAIFLGLLALVFLSAWRGKWLVTVLFGGVWLWACYFFRDPDRDPVQDDPALILSPADGRVQQIEVVTEPLLFDGMARRITIFLSIFDVHVQRSPYSGDVVLVQYKPGSFAPAFSHDADENESNFVGLQTAYGPLGVVQLTGILARRIICRSTVGDHLARGERYGLIRFGSRVDLYLPLDVPVLVQEGDRVAGGTTVLARWTD